MWCGVIRASGADPWTPIRKVLDWRDSIATAERKRKWKDEAARLAAKAIADLNAATAEESRLESEVNGMLIP